MQAIMLIRKFWEVQIKNNNIDSGWNCSELSFGKWEWGISKTFPYRNLPQVWIRDDATHKAFAEN